MWLRFERTLDVFFSTLIQAYLVVFITIIIMLLLARAFTRLHSALLVLLFLAAFSWTWNRWRPFCKLGSPYTILLYCLGICAMWLALMLPPRLNLLHDNFAATFAFIICNYVFLTKCQAWSSFLNEQHGTSNTQHRSRWLWILLYFSFHMPFAFCSYWPFPLVDGLHSRRPLQLTV